MKRIKKCLMVILALCLITASAVNCFAFDNEVLGPIEFTASDVSTNAGETFRVKVSVSGDAEIEALYVLEVKYDESCIEYVGAITNSELITSAAIDPEYSYNPENKTLTLGYTNKIKPNGELITYEFKIKPDSKVTNTEISIQCLATASRNPVTWQVISSNVSVACSHTNKTEVAAVPATCKTEGTKAHEKCSDCGKLFLNGKEVTEAEISTPKDPTNHDGETEIRNAAPATEEAEGYTGDTYCLGCNQKIKDGEKIDKLDHAHAMTHTAATAPTCTTDGVVEHWTCSKCGNSYADEAGTVKLESTVDPKLGHKTELKDAKEATCTEDGYTGDEICTVCNETLKKGETVAAKGHTVETVDAKEATCSEDGYTGDEVCTVCNETIKKGEVIPATGKHEEEVRDAKEADCSNEGYTGDTYCKLCGEKIASGEVIPKNDNHNFEWKVDVEPTFEETGLKHEECTRCGIKRSENTVIEKKDCFHSAMEHHEKVAATCVAAGTCEYWHCAECGRDYSDEKGTLKVEKAEDLVLPIDPNNHVHTELRNVKAATCSAGGYTGDKYCTDCNMLIESGTVTSVDPNAHNYINNVCTYCGNVRVVYRPTTYMYIDDYSHLASGIKERHVPDSMTMHTDGEYEWHYCMYCQHEYGKVPVANIDVDDTIDIAVDDPVQSGDDELIPDVPVTEPEPSEPAQDNNPPTGIAVALLPMALAAAAAIAFKKTNR